MPDSSSPKDNPRTIMVSNRLKVRKFEKEIMVSLKKPTNNLFGHNNNIYISFPAKRLAFLALKNTVLTTSK